MIKSGQILVEGVLNRVSRVETSMSVAKFPS